IWALGVVAYECLTAKAPFTGTTLVGLFQAIRERACTKATALRPELPTTFDAWFERACAPKAENRFAGAQEAVEALAQALALPSAPPSARRDSMADASGPARVAEAHRAAVELANTLDVQSGSATLATS